MLLVTVYGDMHNSKQCASQGTVLTFLYNMSSDARVQYNAVYNEGLEPTAQ